ncbi:Px [Soybean yellow common mosaic virus]|uniref:Px n=1 Tax=Soybean yellow common mosaic virus TaxID=1080798 RepID=UPI0003D406D5|nr:Px [Soybean yellow common mosaic virus]
MYPCGYPSTAEFVKLRLTLSSTRSWCLGIVKTASSCFVTPKGDLCESEHEEAFSLADFTTRKKRPFVSHASSRAVCVHALGREHGKLCYTPRFVHAGSIQVRSHGSSCGLDDPVRYRALVESVTRELPLRICPSSASSRS